jgi:hypothetical protein
MLNFSSDLDNLVINYLEIKYWKKIIIDDTINLFLKKIIVQKPKYHYFNPETDADLEFIKLLKFKISNKILARHIRAHEISHITMKTTQNLSFDFCFDMLYRHFCHCDICTRFDKIKSFQTKSLVRKSQDKILHAGCHVTLTACPCSRCLKEIAKETDPKRQKQYIKGLIRNDNEIKTFEKLQYHCYRIGEDTEVLLNEFGEEENEIKPDEFHYYSYSNGLIDDSNKETFENFKKIFSKTLVFQYVESAPYAGTVIYGYQWLFETTDHQLMFIWTEYNHTFVVLDMSIFYYKMKSLTNLFDIKNAKGESIFYFDKLKYSK